MLPLGPLARLHERVAPRINAAQDQTRSVQPARRECHEPQPNRHGQEVVKQVLTSPARPRRQKHTAGDWVNHHRQCENAGCGGHVGNHPVSAVSGLFRVSKPPKSVQQLDCRPRQQDVAAGVHRVVHEYVRDGCPRGGRQRDVGAADAASKRIRRTNQHNARGEHVQPQCPILLPEHSVGDVHAQRVQQVVVRRVVVAEGLVQRSARVVQETVRFVVVHRHVDEPQANAGRARHDAGQRDHVGLAWLMQPRGERRLDRDIVVIRHRLRSGSGERQSPQRPRQPGSAEEVRNAQRAGHDTKACDSFRRKVVAVPHPSRSRLKPRRRHKGGQAHDHAQQHDHRRQRTPAERRRIHAFR